MNISAEKRFLAFLLTVIMVASLLPITPFNVFAATKVNPIDGKVSVSGGNVTLTNGAVTASFSPTEDSCNGTYTGADATVTVTNISGADAVVSFSYGGLQNVYGAAVTVNGGTDNNGEVSGLLANNGTITLKFKGIDDTAEAASIVLSNFKVSEIKSVKLTVKAPTNGSYTANGTAVTAETTVTIDNTVEVPLVATPASGFKFAGWYNETTGKYISFSASVTLMFDQDTIIVPMFTAESDAVFGINDAAFASLDAALAVATRGSVIRPLKDVTLNKSYTIPAGITLLVPFDDAGTCLTDTTVNYTTATSTPISRAVYRTLTLADGVTLTVNGALSVSAKHRAANGGKTWGGTVEGKYGVLKLNGSSKVNVENGGVLYAYGFVLGSGSVEAKSGGTVYEIMQLTEFLGGSNLLSGLSKHQSNKFFLFSQYYVQNIEADLKINSGANLKVFGTMTISSETMSVPMTFIGEGGMFTLGSGSYAVKSYDASSDRLTIDTYGDVSLSSIAMKLTGLPIVGSADINSADFFLPVNSNITVNINTGTATVNQDLTLLPGCKITVAKGAQVYVPAGTQINLYDQADWGKYAFTSGTGGCQTCIPVSYIGSTGKPSTRTITDDAVLDINGVLANSGTIYTSNTGAQIISSEGNGIFNMKAAPTQATTVAGRLNGGANSSDWVQNTFNPAWLLNDDGTFVETINSAANTGFVFNNATGKWETLTNATITFHANNGTNETTEQTITMDKMLYATKTPLELNGFTYGANDFIGWSTTADGDVEYIDGAEVLFYRNTALYAVWKVNGFKVTWIVNGNSVETDEGVTGIPEFNGTITAPTGYHFHGWDADDDGEVDISIGVPTGDMTIVAIFEACYDNNNDHKCDRTDCGKTLSTCSDKPGDGDHKCDVCGDPIANAGHTPAADDGDCTTAILCTECGAVTTAAKTHVDGNDNNHVCDNEGCTVDNVDGGHTPAADDGNCETAILCTECGAVTTAAKTHVDGDDKNHVCDNAGCTVDNVDGGHTGSYYFNWSFDEDTLSYTVDLWFHCPECNVVQKIADITDEPDVVTAPTCQVHGVYSYCFDFSGVNLPDGWNWEKFELTDINQDNANWNADDKVMTYQLTWKTDPNNHQSLEGTAEDPATCEYSGLKVYWYCSVCDKFFADGDAQNEIDDFATWSSEGGEGYIPATGHGTISGFRYSPNSDPINTHTVICKDCGESTNPNEACSFDANHICVICEQLEKMTVTFMNGDDQFEQMTVTYGYTLDIAGMPDPEAPVGKHFAGWYTSDNVHVVHGMTVTENIVAYANWAVNTYTITWIVNGKETTETYDYGTIPSFKGSTAKDKFICTVYTFAGWATEENGTVITLPYVENDETYYAIYTESVEHDEEYLLHVLAKASTCTQKGNIEFWTCGVCFKAWVDADLTQEIALSDTWLDIDEANHAYVTTNNWYMLGSDYYYGQISTCSHNASHVVYIPVTGVSRVPYPTFGNYGPDDRDASHEEAGVEGSSHYYPDANSALFYFDEDGKFQSTLTGVITVEGELRYVKNGQLIWCAGLVQDGEDYYFFGGNWTVKKDGIVYLYRNDSNIAWAVENGVAMADENGKIITGDGIVNVNGTLYYFNNNCVQVNAGLIMVGHNYYYVRTSGALVTNAKYWITNTNNFDNIPAGTYGFDENGVMDISILDRNGVYEDEDGWYYYENGKRTYKGLMEYNGGYIYVRTDGKLATGKYWITKTNGIEGFSESGYMFDENGYMLSGIVGGFYYENGKTAYKGLIEYNGGYIYVRSNGQLATGNYWVTKTNGLAVVGTYIFNEDGMMDIDGKLPELKNGIVDGYYYEDGILAYAGLIEYNGDYYYVRSSGKLATGKYWITKTNGFMDEGNYTFDENGKMVR